MVKVVCQADHGDYDGAMDDERTLLYMFNNSVMHDRMLYGRNHHIQKGRGKWRE